MKYAGRVNPLNQARAIPEWVRAWVYRVATAVMPLLIAYGIVDDQKAAMWIGVATAVLVPGLAAANTSRTRDGGDA